MAIADRRQGDRRVFNRTAGMSQIDDKLSDIDNMIRRENDEEKRNVLLVLHCLTSTLSVVSRVLEELEKQNHERFEAHETRIDTHEELVLKSKTVWNTAIFFGGIIQAMLMAAAIYGASLFTDLQHRVAVHADRLLVVEQSISNHKSNDPN